LSMSMRDVYSEPPSWISFHNITNIRLWRL
jgi:hypothetical protein